MVGVTLGAGIVSSKGFQVLDRSTGEYVPYQDRYQRYVAMTRAPVPLPREKVIRVTASRLPTAYEQQQAAILSKQRQMEAAATVARQRQMEAAATTERQRQEAETLARILEARRKADAGRLLKLRQMEAAETAARQRQQAEAATAKKLRQQEVEAARQAAVRVRLLKDQQQREAATAKKLREQAAAERAKLLREQRIQAAYPDPPAKRAGVRASEAWYAAIGRPIPESVRETEQRYDQQKFYDAVAGKPWIVKQPGINPSLGVGWMFSVAYGGETMPYWEAWYNKSMSAAQIAYLVAADYTAEIQRRIAVQNQYRQISEAWDDAGQVGPKPVKTPFLQQPQQRVALPALPSIQRRAAPPALPSIQRRAAPPALAPIQRRAALPMLPEFRGKSELPPIIF